MTLKIAYKSCNSLPAQVRFCDILVTDAGRISRRTNDEYVAGG